MDKIRNRICSVFPLGFLDGEPVARTSVAYPARHIHNGIYTLDMVEEFKGTCKSRNGLGGRHNIRPRAGVFHFRVHRTEL